jgi:NADH-ubiquinone oxidoreductase chain 4
MLILGWGYQPERIKASMYILFYTITASLPLLMVLLFIGQDLGRTEFGLLNLREFKVQPLMRIILVGAFIVKFPLYLTHLWLPKAHVEAPVAGSIVLAGVLLKLGGYGLIIMAPIILDIKIAAEVFIRISLIGGASLAVIVLRLIDLKVAIAYSSVVHIAIIIAVRMGVRPLGLVGGVWILLAHGFTSSGMFRGANIIYERSHSRRLVANKGILSGMSFFSALWFTIAVLNFAGPFTLNLFREILIIQRLLKLSLLVGAPMASLCFFSAAYNLNIYASSQQGVAFRGVAGSHLVVGREMLILAAHIWPCVLLLGGLMLLVCSINNTLFL